MDAKNMGVLIAKLRKKSGLTQAQLARLLNISDKAISRWESGIGYPEITQLPELARIFGVTIDYLMTGERAGIAIAGNILTDVVKTVDHYPDIGLLSYITHVSKSVGGCVPNTAIDLATIDRDIPISAIGKVGDDEYGRYLISELNRHRIDTRQISVSATSPTSFSDVISLPSGERTFFHSKGANAQFSPADVDINALNCVILHIGYVFLLDEFDREDAQYGTVMARFLHDVQQHGIKTSIDAVSNSTCDYRAKMLPALKYCDYVIINEFEACMISGLAPYDEQGRVHLDNIRSTMQMMAQAGVREKIVIHCKQAGFAYDVRTAQFTTVASLNIPKEEIKGSVGAGDAFCAGALYGIYNGFDDSQILEFASAAAACNLFSDEAVGGMRSKEEIIKMPQKYGRKTI